MRLLSIFVSCGIALGVQDSSKFLATLTQGWHEKLEIQSRRMLKTQQAEADAFQAMLEMVEELQSAT